MTVKGNRFEAGRSSTPKTVVVLGATGHFGTRISRRIVNETNTRLIVTSRSIDSAERLMQELGVSGPDADIQAAALDQTSADFEQHLAELDPDIVIHTAGPYQGQDYRVARACAECGSHYIDLADGRQFVEEFESLHDLALSHDVLLISGASTLPGLSSVVLREVRDRFETIETVEISIAPAHQTPRGVGTVSAVLSYCGKPFEVLIDGKWTTRYGWQDLRSFRYPELGLRLSGACDVPDLGLVPHKLPDVKTVTFHAALEAKWEQIALWLMGWVVRIKLVDDWARFATRFQRLSQRLIGFGSDRGGMHIRFTGEDHDGNPKTLSWQLTARQNHGPEIPCTPALVLARQLAADSIERRGAYPCWEMFSLSDFHKEVADYAIEWHIDESD